MERLQSVPFLYRWSITLVFVGVIVALSVTPGIERPGDTLFNWLVINTATLIQKAMHVGVYAVLAVLWMWTLERIDSRLRRASLTLIITVGLGVLLEWYQIQVPGRFGSVIDVLLDLAGVLIGLIAALFLL